MNRIQSTQLQSYKVNKTSIPRTEMLQNLAKYFKESISLYSLFWIVLLILGLHFTSKLYKFWTHYSYIRWKLPGPKLDHPIWGISLTKIDSENLENLRNKLKDHPRFCRMVFGPFRSIMITGPEVAQQVINRVDSKNRTFNYMMEPWLGNGLVLSEGAYWKRNRRLLTPTFHYQSLINFVKIINKSTDKMVQVINRDSNGRDPLEFVPLINNMTLETILGCICSKDIDLQMDIDPNSKEMEYVQGLENIRKGMSVRFGSFFNSIDVIYYRKEAGKKFKKGSEQTKQYIVSLVDERETTTKEEPHSEEEGEKKANDMLDFLMKSRDEEGNGLTHKEIVDELNTFVFAGHDTTGSASAFVFYLMAKHPELQDKCREEVVRVLGERNEVEWDDIAKFSYLTSFIKESIRLYPPATFISKMLNKPLTIDGYTIPANTSLDISVDLIHKNANHWPEPNKFDPTRFNDENIVKHHPYAYMPFSAGKRNCIGQNFAMTELKIITALLVKNFQVSLQDGYEMDAIVKVVLSPTDNLPLIFKPL